MLSAEVINPTLGVESLPPGSAFDAGRPYDHEYGKQNENFTNNDGQLVRIFLYPEKGNESLRDDLNGSTPPAERKPWAPQEQKEAEAGMRELLETALEPIRFRGDTMVSARHGLARFQTLPEAQSYRDRAEQYGRKLKYQTYSDYDELQFNGDFLHFGINYDYSDAPDRLPSPLHLYVVPKLPAVGKVAAEFIRKSRERGYEPYGKVWDESSDTEALNDRKDRMHLYVRTESQLQLVMDALQEVQEANPELFEEEPPLLAEQTGIPGVGVVEEPHQTGGSKQSFTQSRVSLLRQAWSATLGQVMGPEDASSETSDSHIKHLQQAVEEKRVTMDELITTYRSYVKELAVAHGVSPDKVSRNL